jgi:hypothetical protein
VGEQVSWEVAQVVVGPAGSRGRQRVVVGGSRWSWEAAGSRRRQQVVVAAGSWGPAGSRGRHEGDLSSGAEIAKTRQGAAKV